MAVFYSADKLAASQKRRFDKCARSMQFAHMEFAEEMKAEAIKLSAGPISSAQLAAMGHPFGRRRGRTTIKRRVRVGPRGFAPLLPINAQSGRLLRSWRLFKRNLGGWQHVQLQNISPESKFVLAPGGTKKMVARGFWTRMRKIAKQKTPAFLRKLRTNNLRIMTGN